MWDIWIDLNCVALFSDEPPLLPHPSSQGSGETKKDSRKDERDKSLWTALTENSFGAAVCIHLVWFTNYEFYATWDFFSVKGTICLYRFFSNLKYLLFNWIFGKISLNVYDCLDLRLSSWCSLLLTVKHNDPDERTCKYVYSSTRITLQGQYTHMHFVVMKPLTVICM